MDIKEVKITPPEGYEIDTENSTFECIKFKKIKHNISGYWITPDSDVIVADAVSNSLINRNVFATKEYAKSALAMAQISQILVNDKRFGGIVTDEEWNADDVPKYIISRNHSDIYTGLRWKVYTFLAFHTEKQRDLFLKENRDLIKEYLMIE